jgi:DNA-binding response OmpR family regulator/EAL domain-containing protein (putative c-di-GMP-specific phosphodiesterase class I)
MNKKTTLHSLSSEITALNSNLSPYIKTMTDLGLYDLLLNADNNIVLFEKNQTDKVLPIIDSIKNDKSRFICIGDNLGSEERLMLLNRNIEFITPEKFSELSYYFFEVSSTSSSQKVLFVEDDKAQILLIEHILTEADITVKSITRAEEVLDMLESFKPDLILMDLNLEGITGDKLVRVIRKKPSFANIPIVFLTADTSLESRMRVLNSGADDLLTKPINPNLLVAALKNRMQRSSLRQVATQPKETTIHNLEEDSLDRLHVFFNENKSNTDASIVWLKVKNKHEIRKKLGFQGFKKISRKMFETIPTDKMKVEFKYEITDGLFVFCSTSMGRKQAYDWVENTQKWLSKNYFSVNEKDYFIDVSAIILTDISNKTEKEDLIRKAENILIDGISDQNIAFLEEGIEEKRFYLVKTQIENSIKTRNFKWHYQGIVSTADESQEIYQVMLRIITDSGKELGTEDYLEAAQKSGLLRLLDRFTLEHAIRKIRSSEHQGTSTRILLNQVMSGFISKEIRSKKLATITSLSLPEKSLVFQFNKEDVQEHMSILGEVGRELNHANIKVCLSNFDCSNLSWKIARKLNVSWIRLRSFKKGDALLDADNPDNLSKTINKAHVLGYKVVVSRVDNAGLAANLWKLNIDYLQGNFIQPAVETLD